MGSAGYNQGKVTEAFALAERSNEAMNKLSASVDMNTKAVEQLVSLLGRKV